MVMLMARDPSSLAPSSGSSTAVGPGAALRPRTRPRPASTVARTVVLTGPNSPTVPSPISALRVAARRPAAPGPGAAGHGVHWPR
eukprot:195517-Hanusia_phi.AAC.5